MAYRDLLNLVFFFKSVHCTQGRDHLFERATRSSYHQSMLLSIIQTEKNPGKFTGKSRKVYREITGFNNFSCDFLVFVIPVFPGKSR